MNRRPSSLKTPIRPANKRIRARRQPLEDTVRDKAKPDVEGLSPTMRVTVKRRWFRKNLVIDEEIVPLQGKPLLNHPRSLFGRLWWAVNPWRKRNGHPWWLTFLLRVFATVVTLTVVLGVVGVIGIAVLVRMSSVPTIPATNPGILLDVTGQQYTDLRQTAGREDVELKSLPSHVPQAVLAAEDHSFYTHMGVNPSTIIRALIANVRSGEAVQGGSTITQQYVKVASGDDSPTIFRKIKEAAQALKVEQTYSKDKILELYLNNVYFGRGATGIQAAAQAYFRVDAKDLSVPQAAMLAGVLPAPSVYDPLVNPRATQRRYEYVLGRMVEDGVISPTQQTDYEVNRPLTYPRPTRIDDPYPWFTDLVRVELEARGFKGGRGLTIRTTIDPTKQQTAEEHFARTFDDLTATGALITLDNDTGSIVSAVGGKDYKADQFNTLRARRQPGSTFKPFALIAWLQEGNDPEQIFQAPKSITMPEADNGKDWTVNNFEGASYDNLNLSDATANSVNTVYAQLAHEAGFQEVADVANTLLDRPRADLLPTHASLVLGTSEVTPVELAGAYATIAADGVLRIPHTITEIRRGDELLYSAQVPTNHVVNQEVDRLTIELLQSTIQTGSAKRANIGRPAAGKTGTTQGHGDAWFAGFTPEYTTVVWMGNRDNRDSLPNKETGGGLPAKLWASYTTAITRGVPSTRFKKPDPEKFDGSPLPAGDN
ncbi:transglycosylase domain-containing protein [Stomatohabitans albus]|uniref:transglycosylase domain-containing protein n=1 Tax=Stomatohabitans albus TaxID=3110766 RepID=UPI00300D8DCA